MRKKHIAICFGIVCFVLVFSIFAQGRTVKNMQKKVGKKFNKNADLIDEVFKAQQEYDDLYSQLERSEAKLAHLLLMRAPLPRLPSLQIMAIGLRA